MSETTTVGIHNSCWSFLRWKSVVIDRISGLPDELLGHILSYLTIRDSVRTRLLSRRWRNLNDSRSVLHFDAVNLLPPIQTKYNMYPTFSLKVGPWYLWYGWEGEQRRETKKLLKYQSKFARVVDRFIQVRTTDYLGLNNLDEVKIDLDFNKVERTRINGWVRSFVRMRVKVLELNQYPQNPIYVLSSRLLYSGEDDASNYLTCLRLNHCELRLSVGHSTSWISRLTTLDLSIVSMRQDDMEFILCNASNLTSLRLRFTHDQPNPSSMKVRLPKLKKLVLVKDLDELVLDCPNLEILDVDSCLITRLIFSDVVPLLSRVDFGLMADRDNYSQNFVDLTRYAPNLHTLSLYVPSDAVHPIPANAVICRLKRLDVELRISSSGLGMFTIANIMTVYPFLELLHLTVNEGFSESPQSECSDRRHFHLKEVKIDGRTKKRAEKKFARYLLKNAVVLRRLVVNGVCSWR